MCWPRCTPGSWLNVCSLHILNSHECMWKMWLTQWKALTKNRQVHDRIILVLFCIAWTLSLNKAHPSLKSSDLKVICFVFTAFCYTKWSHEGTCQGFFDTKIKIKIKKQYNFICRTRPVNHDDFSFALTLLVFWSVRTLPLLYTIIDPPLQLSYKYLSCKVRTFQYTFLFSVDLDCATWRKRVKKTNGFISNE